MQYFTLHKWAFLVGEQASLDNVGLLPSGFGEKDHWGNAIYYTCMFISPCHELLRKGTKRITTEKSTVIVAPEHCLWNCQGNRSFHSKGRGSWVKMRLLQTPVVHNHIVSNVFKRLLNKIGHGEKEWEKLISSIFLFAHWLQEKIICMSCTWGHGGLAGKCFLHKYNADVMTGKAMG